ncbi:short-chain-enoyl-CoA hydratase [Clostridium sp. HCP1S3_B4]|uniref:short-chain-enoyl-CoA hydratase n=1 Tax=unclassified Clostridium TaxID=2614128 RepID=UPI00168FC085|nr:short-chain-enoyl-CoA hydratase [Clostridiales bacterium]MDY2729940.1 short-chain-enoyl-CoA hydratase [Clostridium sp.]NLK24567.1 short-chain-enoyl-CoA hydratase [Clostridiales bacterium]
MELKNVILEKEEHLAIVTINRPKALNALNSETLKDLDTVIADLENDSNIYAVILTGAGEKSFVAGADISEMKDLNENEGKEFGSLGNKVFLRLENLNKPVIAAIQGFALGGGCEISMACDIRIASDKAVFGQPEVGLGITPGFGGTQRLARIVGLGKAKEMIYTARNIKADEAYRIGLVNKVVPLESLMDEAKAMASKIIANAPIAVRMSKDAINRGMQVSIDKAVEIEAENFGKCFASSDQTEGMTAFLERRKEKNFQNK